MKSALGFRLWKRVACQECSTHWEKDSRQDGKSTDKPIERTEILI